MGWISSLCPHASTMRRCPIILKLARLHFDLPRFRRYSACTFCRHITGKVELWAIGSSVLLLCSRHQRKLVRKRRRRKRKTRTRRKTLKTRPRFVKCPTGPTREVSSNSKFPKFYLKMSRTVIGREELGCHVGLLENAFLENILACSFLCVFLITALKVFSYV